MIPSQPPIAQGMSAARHRTSGPAGRLSARPATRTQGMKVGPADGWGGMRVGVA